MSIGVHYCLGHSHISQTLQQVGKEGQEFSHQVVARPNVNTHAPVDWHIGRTHDQMDLMRQGSRSVVVVSIVLLICAYGTTAGSFFENLTFRLHLSVSLGPICVSSRLTFPFIQSHWVLRADWMVFYYSH